MFVLFLFGIELKFISLDLTELKELLRDESPVEKYVEWLENIFKAQVLRVSNNYSEYQ